MSKTQCCQALYFVALLLFGSVSLAQEEAHSHSDSKGQKMEHMLHELLHNENPYFFDSDSAKILLAWTETQEGVYYEASSNYLRLHYSPLWKSSMYETIVSGNSFATKCDVLPYHIQVGGLNALRQFLQSAGRHEEGLGLTIRVCELREQMGGVKCCFELGKVYYDLKQYEQAISKYLLNAEFFRANGNELMESSAYNDIGSCYEELSQSDSAVWAYNKALQILKEGPSDHYRQYFSDIIRWNQLEAQHQELNLPEHQVLIQRVIRNAYVANETPWITKGYKYFAQLNYDAGKLHLAIAYCDSAIDLLSTLLANSETPAFLELKGRSMLLLGEKEGAKQVFLRSQNLKDSLELASSEIRGSVAAAFYESKEKEKEVARFSQEAKAANLIAEQERRNIRNVSLAALAISVLAFILGFLVIKLRRAQKVERSQRSALEQSLKDKEVLLKEIHHRVKNNLQVISSLLDLQTLKMEDGTAKSALEEGKSRVQSIAILHHQLYQHDDLVQVDLKTFSDELFKQVLGVFKKPNQQVEVSLDISQTLIDIDTAVPFGLILNELFTNSFKYAFNDGKPGRIEMRVEQQRDSTSGKPKNIFVYRDSGPGLPSNIELSSANTLGLRLIATLSEQFKGTSSYQYNNGAEFSITF